MGYSKMVYVEVQNFMSYKQARLDFDETGIVNIKGYNDSGKSTILRAVGCCLMDLYSKDQAKLIRHGESYFRVVVGFDDGVTILRDKYSNGQSLYEMYKDGELVYTTKQGSKLTKISGVPDVIQNYLGLCILESGCLNYQSRDDKLWLIETKGSENYYSLNEILKTEEIARANTLINSDKNKLGSEIAQIEADLQENKLLLDNASLVTEELILNLVEREENAQKLYRKYTDMIGIGKVLGELIALKKLPKIDKINTSKAEALLEIQKTLLEMQNLVMPPKVERLDNDKLKLLERIKATASGITGKHLDTDVKSINIEQLKPLSSLRNTLESVSNAHSEKIKLEKSLKVVQGKLAEEVEKAKQRGTKFIQCDNCGSYMEVGINAG